ncbi:nucleotide-diphospho-sugar transferase [Pilobolus umbonatus]|nr:nucleotide-diphospho-sugar transferase [Pilobolus umbonatus]
MKDNAAWAIVLTSSNSYIKGVISIKKALHEHHSRYPLLILHTSAVKDKIVDLLKDIGCVVKKIEGIVPQGTVTYTATRFIETWTKLSVWNETDFSRLVMLDADMLPLKNMDELMEVYLPDTDWIAACHACICNPLHITHYPVHWIPENCAYTQASSTDYFNSGLVVLTPNHDKFMQMLNVLNDVQDLNIYPFPDQDFLNEIFKLKWSPLPYIYNALKTLERTHAPMWIREDVKNVHYIMSKPWDIDPQDELSEVEDQFRSLYELWWDQFNKMDKTAMISQLDGLLEK